MCDVNDERTVNACWCRDELERAILDALAAAGIYEEGENMPKMWRVYSGSDGQSHISELPLTMQPFVDADGAHGESSAAQSVTGIVFRVAPPGYVLGWHCAPRRQYAISLSGAAEIEVGDGTVARIGPGDVVLAEDLSGQGHITRVVGPEPRSYAVIALAEP